MTAKATCDDPTPTFSVTADATPFWNGWKLQGVTGEKSGPFIGPTEAYKVVATWTKKVLVTSGYKKCTCDVKANIHGTNRNVSRFYDKPTGDQKHCHRIVWDKLTKSLRDQFRDMHNNNYNYGLKNHGSWEAAYNNHIKQNPSRSLKCVTIPPVYKTSTETRTQSGVLDRPDCYQTCLVENQKQYDITDSGWYNVGPEYGFGEAQNMGDGIYCKFGSQDQQKDIAWKLRDINMPEVDCGSGGESFYQTVEVKSCYAACDPNNTTTAIENDSGWVNDGGPYSCTPWTEVSGQLVKTCSQDQKRTWDNVTRDKTYPDEICSSTPDSDEKTIEVKKYKDTPDEPFCPVGYNEVSPAVLVDGEWTDPECEQPNAPVCGKDFITVQESIWDEELGVWTAPKCRCRTTGFYNYNFTGAANSQLPTCTLTALVGEDVGFGKIPLRFKNPEYVNKVCSCPDCEGNDRSFITNGDDPKIVQENKCMVYPGPLCP